jgi:threonine/homoserine/homoserine lactone efflux protein
LGLALFFSRFPAAMTALRFAGGSYLAWLGVRSLYRALRHSDGGVNLAGRVDPVSSVRAHAGSFRQGVTVNLLNPAIATFYLVVLPSFIPADAPRWYFAALASIHILMALACHGVWALALDKVRRLFHPPAARRTLEGATGIALIALAMRVLISNPLNP